MPRLRVQEIAKAQGWTISTLQRRADISMPTARRYWYGTKSGKATDEALLEFHIGILKQIAVALGVKIADLIEDERGSLCAAAA